MALGVHVLSDMFWIGTSILLLIFQTLVAFSSLTMTVCLRDSLKRTQFLDAHPKADVPHRVCSSEAVHWYVDERELYAGVGLLISGGEPTTSSSLRRRERSYAASMCEQNRGTTVQRIVASNQIINRSLMMLCFSIIEVSFALQII